MIHTKTKEVLKMAKKLIALRVKPEIHAQISEAAHGEHRTIANFCEKTILEKVQA